MTFGIRQGAARPARAPVLNRAAHAHWDGPNLAAVDTALFLARLIEIYALVGLLVGGWFALVAAPRLDPAARGASLGFRLLIWPAAAALWPQVLVRLVRRSPPPLENTAHRRAEREHS